MSDRNIAAGEAAAAAFYAMVFAPLSQSLGTTGGMLIDSASQACAAAPHDELAQQFSAMLAAATRA